MQDCKDGSGLQFIKFDFVTRGQEFKIVWRPGRSNERTCILAVRRNLQKFNDLSIPGQAFVSPMHNNNQKDQTKRPRDQRSPSEEKLSPDYKTARHHEDKMAEPTLEEDDISLKDIKQTLDAIQKTLGEVLSQNVQFKNEVMELKASSRANNRQLEDLKAKVTKLTEENLLLRNELDQSRLRVQTLYEEKDDLWDSLDSLEMYSRKNSIEIHGVPREACPSTEEVVLKIADALEVDIDPHSIEISHRTQRKNSDAIIVKFLSHKDKVKMYKSRTKLKAVKVSALFPECPLEALQERDSIFLF